MTSRPEPSSWKGILSQILEDTVSFRTKMGMITFPTISDKVKFTSRFAASEKRNSWNMFSFRKFGQRR
eukprot:3920472-Pyramimonas_sp.AAC.1